MLFEISHIAKRHVEKTIKTGEINEVLVDIGTTYLSDQGKLDKNAAKIIRCNILSEKMTPGINARK